jgi:hypothetical protein
MTIKKRDFLLNFMMFCLGTTVGRRIGDSYLMRHLAAKSADFMLVNLPHWYQSDLFSMHLINGHNTCCPNFLGHPIRREEKFIQTSKLAIYKQKWKFSKRTNRQISLALWKLSGILSNSIILCTRVRYNSHATIPTISTILIRTC